MQSQTSPIIEPLAVNKTYKWIRREIELSDPYTDYAKIFRLTMEYTGSSFFMSNLLYALTFSNFIPTQHGATTVWRADGGKVLHAPTERMHETLLHNSTWWYYGPHHEKTKESVQVINRRHQGLAKRYPGAFSYTLDYVYVLCFSAALVHRFRVRLGLRGYSEKQKVAAHLTLKELAKLFLVEQPNRPDEDWVPLLTVAAFPENWDGILEVCEDVEKNHLQVTDEGHMIAEALFDHFAYNNFPPLLRPLGRAIPIALSIPELLVAHRIKPINAILRWIIICVAGGVFWFMEAFMPDPKVAVQEVFEKDLRTRKAQKRDERRVLDSGFPKTFASNHQGAKAACPFILKKHDS